MCYFSTILKDPGAATAVIAHNLRHPKLGRVDCVVGTGLSGTLPLVSVRQMTGLPVVALRKAGVASHGPRCEGVPWLPSHLLLRYVILDDFTESGSTAQNILAEMKIYHPRWVCAGAVFYASRSVCWRILPEGVPVRLDISDEIDDVVDLLAKGEELP